MPTKTVTPIEIPYFTNGASLFSRIRDLPYACWLDSGRPHSLYGRYDIITAAPHQRLETSGDTTHAYQLINQSLGDDTEELLYSSTEAPWQLLKAALQNLTVTQSDPSLPFTGGALGYFGYDLGAQTASQNTMQLPLEACQFGDMHIGIYFWAIIQDHQTQKSYLVALPECHEDILQEVHRRVIDCTGNTSKQLSQTLHVNALVANTSPDEYTEKLHQINQYIHAGDCYQVNFAQCFHATYSGDPYEAYIELRKTMASPYSAFIRIKGKAILSLSPERFVKVEKNKVLAQPIKGTAPRHDDPTQDQKNADELQASDKNRAENVMIVDLLRNDLGKNCIPGSIKVPSLFELESYPNVHHLVSSITGEIANNKSAVDILEGCFPGGSITGAPKKRAMEIIDELENYRRSIYCGSIAYINTQGDMDSNITIRTIACDGESLYCWGGGGIVADSESEDEYQESLTKIASLLATLANFKPET